jgi:MFS family permease
MTQTIDEAAAARAQKTGGKGILVIAGASLGTLFEWYDFFLYGSLASYIAQHFFSAVEERTAFLFALAAFAAGFIVRPFGALVFGRIGDMVGRKNTFLVTMTIMGLATFLVGCLPGYETLGIAAPIALVALRLLQGLAVGGEYGGAAIYVAEHAKPGRRAFDTSWINLMATCGLFVSLAVIIALRTSMSKADFQAWGWRAPFLVSVLLLGLSLWVRLKLEESPVFRKMKAENNVAKAPWSEAFGRWSNLKWVLVALAAVIGNTVIWYTAQFYALFFLQRVLKLDDLVAYQLVALALLASMPLFPLIGWLSDRLGRKPFVVAGCVLGAIFVFPLFHELTRAANPALAAASASAPVSVHADPARCSVQFDPVGANKFDTTDCDIAKAFLSRAGVSYASVDLPAGGRAEVHVGGRVIPAPDPRGLAPEARAKGIAGFGEATRGALSEVGYPLAADPAHTDRIRVILIVVTLVLFAALAYAPGAAFMTELFPARVRYTSLSLPYHLGSGWFGGLLPATAFAIVAASGDIYAGLWYPVSFAAAGAVIAILFLPETRGRPIQ